MGGWGTYTWYMKLCPPHLTLDSINFHMILFMFALLFSLLGAAGAPWIGCWGPCTWYMKLCPPNWTLESTNFHMVLLIFVLMCSLLGAAGAPWIGCWGHTLDTWGSALQIEPWRALIFIWFYLYLLYNFHCWGLLVLHELEAGAHTLDTWSSALQIWPWKASNFIWF